MDALFGLFIIFISLVPFLIVLLFYLAIIGLVVWFVIVLLRSQKERNALLREISHKLDRNQQKGSYTSSGVKHDEKEIIRAAEMKQEKAEEWNQGEATTAETEGADLQQEVVEQNIVTDSEINETTVETSPEEKNQDKS